MGSPPPPHTDDSGGGRGGGRRDALICAVWLHLSRVESWRLQAPRNGSTLIWFLSIVPADQTSEPPFPRVSRGSWRAHGDGRGPDAAGRTGGAQPAPAGPGRLLGWKWRLRGWVALAPHGPANMEPCWILALGWAAGERLCWNQTCPHVSTSGLDHPQQALTVDDRAPALCLGGWQEEDDGSLWGDAVSLGPRSSCRSRACATPSTQTKITGPQGRRELSQGIRLRQ